MGPHHVVFVSSTFLDLQAERQRIMEVLLRSRCIPAGMELFPAGNVALLELIRKQIDECDCYLVMVGGRYGSVDRKSGLSYTELEHRYAVKRNKYVIAMLHKDPSKLPAKAREQGRGAGARGRKLNAFRQKLQRPQKGTVAYWTTADLTGHVSTAVDVFKREARKARAGLYRINPVKVGRISRAYVQLVRNQDVLASGGDAAVAAIDEIRRIAEPPRRGYVVDPGEAATRLRRWIGKTARLNAPGRFFQRGRLTVDGDAEERTISSLFAAPSQGSRVVLIHGMRGSGKSTALLRAVAAPSAPDARLVMDFGAHSGRPTRAAWDELEAALSRAGASHPAASIVVDGLDAAWRAERIIKRRIFDESLAEDVGQICRMARDAFGGKPVSVVFTADDKIALMGDGLDSSENSSTSAMRTAAASRAAEYGWYFESLRFEPTADEDEVRRELVEWSDDKWSEIRGRMPWLRIPVFLDALRGLERGAHAEGPPARRCDLLALSVRGPNPRPHPFVTAARAALRFEQHLSRFKPDAPDPSLIGEIVHEMTNEWAYLVKDFVGLEAQIWKVHNWLVGEPATTYGGTYALSNVVSTLALLNAYDPAPPRYEFCNLQDAEMGKAKVGTEFVAVDLRGANMGGLTIEPAARFTACLFDPRNIEDLRGKANGRADVIVAPLVRRHGELDPATASAPARS